MRITNHFPTALYRLAEGDTLEVIYLTRPKETSAPYKLQVKDAIDLEFTYHPEMNRTVRVRPDGKISIPRKRDVSVAGMTPDQVSAMLRRAYSDLLKDPEITVTVREFGAKLDELQKAITTAPYGQARVVAIRPDGNISLPLITDMKAAGLTVPQLTEQTNRVYRNPNFRHGCFSDAQRRSRQPGVCGRRSGKTRCIYYERPHHCSAGNRYGERNKDRRPSHALC